MDEQFNYEPTKGGINRTLIAGVVIGLIVIAIVTALLLRRPSMNDQTAALLTGAMRADSPGFADVNKDILIADDNSVESPVGTGTISMYIRGKIRNKGPKNISMLEVNVAVIDQQNQVLREKNVLVVPVQQPALPAGATIPITLSIEGFDRKDDRANIRWKVTAIKVDN